ATVPLGLVVGLLLGSPQGNWYVVLMMAPLLMARHAFKMYLDSRSMNMRIIASLCSAIDAKDHYTQGHTMRVANYSKCTAEAMHKPVSFVENITIAAMLHDVGKIGINDALLLKPEALTAAEYNEIKRHPEIGQKIIKSVQFPRDVHDAVLYHHLNYDLTGYPVNSKTPAQQPVSAAILAVADTYDAMTSDRPYRAGMTSVQAAKILREVAGTQLHPEVVEIFLQILPSLKVDEADDDFELQLEMLT
ncbi:MAG: HD-GYP domain-containing protein, partial [Oscillospiraceae bacterium]